MIKRNDHIFAEMNQWAMKNNPNFDDNVTRQKEFDNIFELILSEINEKYGEKLKVLSKIICKIREEKSKGE